MRHNGWPASSSGGQFSGGIRIGRIKNVTFDSILGDDADAHHTAGAAIVVHGVQNGCKMHERNGTI